MRELFVLIAHLITTLVKLALPGGVREITAESLALKQQLLVLQRRQNVLYGRHHGIVCSSVCVHFGYHPTVEESYRLSFGLRHSGRFHEALIRCKYRFLYIAKRRGKPGPKRPSKEIIAAVVEMKRRNPRFGCLKIAQQISYAFGIEVNKDVARRILEKHPVRSSNGDGPSWLTAIAHAKDNLRQPLPELADRNYPLFLPGYPAQQDSCVISLLKVCAASFKPSTIVR